MPYEFGDVVLVQFPFTSQKAFKKRPAVVVSNKSYNQNGPDVVIMAVTSQIGTSYTQGGLLLSDWQAGGLLKPSVVKPVFATLEQRLILSRLGLLSAQDQNALRTAIRGVLG
ncbi:MAG TPA: type II toxin-antitoxin system PemK/MazF family toxin [Acidobacteriaceae bacterium]|nr:type II toxin-antitoxin system PemK/MazF family toxin [Acidobacteriaceae bacterium]